MESRVKSIKRQACFTATQRDGGIVHSLDVSRPYAAHLLSVKRLFAFAHEGDAKDLYRTAF